MRQRPRDGHALHLAARKLVWQARGLVFEFHPPPPVARRPCRPRQQQRQLHVLEHGKRGQQLKELKHEAHARAAQGREFAVVERPGGAPVDQHLAAGWEAVGARYLACVQGHDSLDLPMQDRVAELITEGYTIVRGFLSPSETADLSAETHRMYQEGLKHHATYRDKNLLFEVLNDPKANRRVVLQAHWTAWLSPLMEQMRRSEKYFAVLEAFLGADIKQISHQVHWKPPGAKYTSYRFHQDARFREGRIKNHDYLESTLTTGLAIE